jgi:digeranylgeranylglycerophospholipid reductase
MPPPLDAAIIGGGPAGLFAGQRLARAGYRVRLFEEHDVVGLPVHCTGVLAAEAFDDFGLSRASMLNELRTVRFMGPSGDEVEYSTPRVEAVVIDRALLDRELAEAAVFSGVELTCGARVTGVEADASGVSITTGGRVVRARVALLACGANYAVQRRLDLGIPRLMLHSAQIEVPASRLHAVDVHLGEDVAPRGFAWAVPVERERPHVRIGVVCDRQAPRFFRRMVERVSGRWGVDPADVGTPRLKMLPLGPITRTYANRLLVIGDAAGLVKPTTGGGIYYSLLSAQIAADTLEPLMAGDRLTAANLAPYERAWRRRLGSELRWQLLLRRIAWRLTDDDLDRLFDLARTDGIMPLVRRTAAFNEHRAFITALFRHPPTRRVLVRAVLT